ncbi:MAG: biopolymer transporter ExbD [Campylobacteraceae bacterium]|jgi:biopolymer transport protein ExbD|nr:biopolymer transporter ExbD [Campylobacteraceae bacterium]
MFDWNENPELNITPLVDVMLVLLAILMVTTPILVYEEGINLPSGSKTTQITEIPYLEIQIDKQRDVHIISNNKKNKFSLKELPDNMVLLSNSHNKDTAIHIKADKELFYNDVMFVLKSLKEAGFLKIALETSG